MDLPYFLFCDLCFYSCVIAYFTSCSQLLTYVYHMLLQSMEMKMKKIFTPGDYRLPTDIILFANN